MAEAKGIKKQHSMHKIEAPIGYRHGLPAWQLFSGNLPVVSKEFHMPPPGVAAGPTAYDYYSGNMPVLSRDYHVNKSSIRDSKWVELIDFETGKTFWWNRRFRSRREEAPAATDDGREGAGEGESDATLGPKWIEEFDPEAKRLYYINMRNAATQWVRPPDFAESGKDYTPVWQKVQKDGSTAYQHTETGAVEMGKPADFDGDASPADPIPRVPPPQAPEELLLQIELMSVAQRQYTNHGGWVLKEGGGSGFFSSSSKKRRWLQLTDGLLAYYASKEKADDREPQKDLYIDVDNYVIEATEASATEFSLVPIPLRAERAFKSAGDEPCPEPKRVFRFECLTADDKKDWLDALMGQASPYWSPPDEGGAAGGGGGR